MMNHQGPTMVSRGSDMLTSTYIQAHAYVYSTYSCSSTHMCLTRSQQFERQHSRIFRDLHCNMLGSHRQQGPVRPREQLHRTGQGGEPDLSLRRRAQCRFQGTPCGRPSCAGIGVFHPSHDVPETSRLWKEEIFGPVLCIRVRNRLSFAILSMHM